MRRLSLFASLLTVGLFLGCATARVVSVQPGEGGVVAVAPAHDPEAREKAEALMRRNCQGRKYKIVSEDEAVVGQQTHVTGNDYQFRRSGTYSASAQTQNETEWRIKYKCE